MSTAMLDKMGVYEVGPCKKKKGNHVEIYGPWAKSSQPFDPGCRDEYQNCHLSPVACYDQHTQWDYKPQYLSSMGL